MMFLVNLFIENTTHWYEDQDNAFYIKKDKAIDCVRKILNYYSRKNNPTFEEETQFLLDLKKSCDFGNVEIFYIIIGKITDELIGEKGMFSFSNRKFRLITDTFIPTIEYKNDSYIKS